MNCLVVPFAIVGASGVMASAVGTAGVTVRLDVPTVVPEVAEMLTEPVDKAVASPR